MVEAAEKNGVKLLAGHTASLHACPSARCARSSSRQARQAARDQRLAYTDWMLRPRSADELDLDAGRRHSVPPGPAPDRHGARAGRRHAAQRARHDRPVDARAADPWLLRGLPRVRGRHARHDRPQRLRLLPRRRAGPVGRDRAALHAGRARRRSARRWRPARATKSEDKQDLRIGGEEEDHEFRAYRSPKPWVPEDLGLLIVSCDRGDIRHSAYGIYVYDDDGLHEIDLTPDRVMGGAGAAACGARGDLRRCRAAASRSGTTAAGGWGRWRCVWRSSSRQRKNAR